MLAAGSIYVQDYHNLSQIHKQCLRQFPVLSIVQQLWRFAEATPSFIIGKQHKYLSEYIGKQ